MATPHVYGWVMVVNNVQSSHAHGVELMREKERGGGGRVKVYVRERDREYGGSYFERDRENVTGEGGRLMCLLRGSYFGTLFPSLKY